MATLREVQEYAQVDVAQAEGVAPASGEVGEDAAQVHVAVGSVVHPMEADHYIQWIAIETEQGVQRKTLKPGEKPEASFALASGDKLIAAYEYCNKHGLWTAKA